MTLNVTVGCGTNASGEQLNGHGSRTPNDCTIYSYSNAHQFTSPRYALARADALVSSTTSTNFFLRDERVQDYLGPCALAFPRSLLCIRVCTLLPHKEVKNKSVVRIVRTKEEGRKKRNEKRFVEKLIKILNVSNS